MLLTAKLHRNLTLFNAITSTGVSIPYPAISLHAIQRLADPADTTKEVQGLYMQLGLSDPYGVTDDDEQEIVELTLIPSSSGDASIKELFEAVSNCSNLHPDPIFEDEEMEDGDGDTRIVFEGSVGYEGISGLPGVQRGAADGGLPPPFPGSGGWITAENVSEYFDAEGNWIADEAENGQNLGEGAGRVRTREELDGDGLNGHGEHDDDVKRPRTD
jgi:nucleotide-sensitive chloride channel 1A